MSRNARLQLLVLCIVCLILVPVVGAAQMAGRPQPLPPEMMPGPGRTSAGDWITPSSLLPYLPDGPSLPWTAVDPASQPTGAAQRQYFDPGYHPEGDWNRVVFQAYMSHNKQYDLAVVHSLSNMTVAKLTDSAANEAQPAISPDGRRIAYASDAAGNYDIYVAAYDPVAEKLGPPVRLTSNSYDELWPVWSADGARLAFHGIRSGSRTDIFTMNADGSGLANLTNYEGIDAFPTWSPDGKRLAFSSLRTGGYRIHVMNADGSGVGQLSNLAYSIRPTWSPDGKRIAFTADHNNDGWWDLMLMNADGGSLRVLYSANGDYMPEDYEVRAWSSDGKFVSFTRIRYLEYEGQWYIQGAEPMFIGPDNATYGELLVMPFSFEPHRHSIDLQSPQTAVAALPAESPYRYTIRWDGRDIGPAGLNLFDVQMQTDGGPWVDLETETTWTEEEIEGTAGQQFAFRSRGRDYAGNVEPWPATPDAVTVIESHPPVTSIAPLPPFTRMGDPVYVPADIQDVGGSGVFGVDSQFRRNGGEWQDWQYDPFTLGFSPGANNIEAGDQVDFRVRGIDYAGNVEPWPPDPGQASTAYFSRIFSGWITDNTGVPVGGAAAAANPAALNTVDSAADGRFTAYMGVLAPSQTLLWSKPGYGALPPVMRSMSGDRGQTVVMPPADDMVDNGGFEDGDWGAWVTGGSIPPLQLNDADAANSGTTAAALGARSGPVGTPSLVTNTAQRIEYRPIVALDGDGDPVLVWADGETGALYRAMRRADGTWDAVKLMDDQAWDYDLVLDPEGLLYLVVRSDAVYLWRQSGNGWLDLGKVPNTTGASQVEVGPGLGGRLDVVYLDPEGRIFHTRRVNGTWSTRTQLQGPTGLWWHNFAATTASDGSFHIVWDEGNMGQSFLQHRRIAPDGTWGPITTTQPSGHPHFALAADPFGGVHLGWRTTAHMWFTGVYYRSWTNGTWGPVEMLGYRNVNHDSPMIWEASADGAVQTFVQESRGGTTFMRRDASGAAVTEPLPLEYGFIQTMAVDKSGGAHMVFAMESPGGENAIYYITRSPSGDWSEPFRVSEEGENAEWPWLDVTPQGVPSIVWEDRPNPEEHLRDIGFAGPEVAAGGGGSTLSQVVNVPAGMAHPVLSFLYQSRGALLLELEGVDERAAAWSGEWPSSPTGMRHSWLDLSDYSGQAVRITFRLEQASGAPSAWAIIDDVSVGAAHTDISVQGESGGRLANDTVIHTVRVSNDSALAAGGVAFTYTLPPALSFVSADPAPTSLSPLRWQLGSLAAGTETTIRITTSVAVVKPPRAVTSTAVVTTSDAELELINNTAEIVSHLDRWMALPVVLRP